VPDEKGVSFERGHIDADGIEVGASGHWTREGRYQVRVDGKGDNLATLSAIAGFEVPRQHFELGARIDGSSSAVTITEGRLAAESATAEFGGSLDWRVRKGEFQLDARSPDASRLLPAGAFQPVAAPIEARGTIRWSGERIEFEDVHVAAVGATARISGTLDDGLTAPVRVQVEVPELAALGAVNGERLPAIGVSGRAAMSLDATTVVIDDIDVQVAQNRLAGAIRFTPPADSGERARVDGTLTSPHIDLRSGSDETGSSSKGEPILASDPLPFTALDRIDSRVKFDIERLDTTTFGSVRLAGDVRLEAGKLVVSANGQGTEGGTIAIEATVERQSDGAAIRLDATGVGMRLPLLGAQGQATSSMPAYGLRASLTSSGASPHALGARLNGALRLTGGRGEIDRSNLEIVFGDIVTQVAKALNPWDKSDEYSQQECSAYLVRVQDGKIVGTPGLVVRTDQITAFAQGTIDLDTEQIDLRFQSRPRARLSISAGEVLTPFTKVGGTLSEPGLTVDAPSSVLSGGLAVATGGLSLLLMPVWDRLTRSDTPCEDAVAFFESETALR
jgi:hypothetical protein